ncbi:hypothetical protein SAMN05216464_11068 [Mucilaginibacter pineti]|uniref:Uncharacterized protein n=1 Tax=Mucilaginibacter pineti TaxID=1391627 RepID=A0A1G7GBS3_9SPHI|nr:hypothetical protein [Mucilaginibacter pineti]SDE85570.1 hypothetical protein SAMN05216464_11068 [Mucilaginibacter pineti]
MNTEIEYLKNIAEEIAANQNKKPLTKPDKHLQVEAKRLEQAITVKLHTIDNFTQRETFYHNILSKLVIIADILFDISDNINPDVRLLLNLLDAVRRIVPSEVSPKLQLPKAFIHDQKQIVIDSWKDQEQRLKIQNVDSKLIEVAAIPFSRFATTKHKLYWRDFIWLKGYEEKLENLDWENADCASPDEALMSMLIGIDFNDDRFFIFCKKYIKTRLDRHHLKKRRLAELAECEKLILQDTQNEQPTYNHRRHDISFKLISWIKKESDAIKLNEALDEDMFKIEFNWDVDTIALFWKYLMEHGVTKMVNIEVYAKQIAATCSSKGKVEFKWETIKGRFYGKDQKYLKKIYDPLTSVIEDIRRFLR